MHLHDYLGWPGPVTHRQHMVWVQWQRDEWNNPSRTDHHLMRVAQRVIQAVVKHPDKVELENQQVKFLFGPAEEQTGPDQNMTVELATVISQARWVSRMTVPIVHKNAETRQTNNS